MKATRSKSGRAGSKSKVTMDARELEALRAALEGERKRNARWSR